MGTYAYDGSDDIDAQEKKPQAVVEAEFRLSDDLYTLGTVSTLSICLRPLVTFVNFGVPYPYRSDLGWTKWHQGATLIQMI
jgi:hypothetical protein